MTVAWTINQLDLIRNGVLSGRAAMKKRGISALVFADAFAKAAGIQVPGMPAVANGMLRQIGSHVILNLIDGSGARSIPDAPDWVFNAVAREMNRAYSEAYWVGAADHPDTIGFRLMVYENVSDIAGCRCFAECDNYGLGQGIFPKGEIVILPPCCDRAVFEVVFKDEIR